jgi:predicted acyltransferase
MTCVDLILSAIIDTLIYHLNHTVWEGLRFYDCIWPSFMLMVGVSVSFSYAERSLTQTWSQMLAHALKRSCSCWVRCESRPIWALRIGLK